MNVRTLARQIQRQATNRHTGAMPEYGEVLDFLQMSADEVLSKQEWDFNKISLEPAIQTEPGVRNYSLPRNFSGNFLDYYNPDTGDLEHSVKVDDGSTVTDLTFEAIEVFYRRDLSAESNETPSAYTIQRTPSFSYEIVLAPPPDTTSYTISGVYAPSYLELLDSDDLPPVPRNYSVLRYDVLRKLEPSNPQHENNFREALAYLYLDQAKANPSRMVMQRDRFTTRGI